MAAYLAVQQVADAIPSINGAVLKSAPPTTRKGFYLTPWMLDFSEDAKVGKFPSNVAARLHLPSILQRGFETEREPLEVRFQSGVTELGLFSVKYIDGHTKGMLVQAVFGLLIYCVRPLLPTKSKSVKQRAECRTAF